jgi:hypothetical protein
VSTYASAAHGSGSVYSQKSSWNAQASKPKFAQPVSLQALPELPVSEAMPHVGGGAGSLGGGLKQLSSVHAMGAGAVGGSGMTGSFARRHYRRKKDGVSVVGGGGLTSLPMPSGTMKKL